MPARLFYDAAQQAEYASFVDGIPMNIGLLCIARLARSAATIHARSGDPGCGCARGDARGSRSGSRRRAEDFIAILAPGRTGKAFPACMSASSTLTPTEPSARWLPPAGCSGRYQPGAVTTRANHLR